MLEKSYHHILSKRLTNQVLAIAYDKLDTITSQVTIRLMQGAALEQVVTATPHTPVESKNTPIIEVFDSLVAKGGAGASGYTSYESITKSLQKLVADGNKDIVMYIDSPGGEVSGLFALTSYMQALKEQGINLIGVTDGLCASAAYAIGSACSSLQATNGSEIGSIGVITALVDATKMDEERGLQYTILRSKSEKALGNPHETITDAVITKTEEKLAQYDAVFNTVVNKNRPQVSIESIVAMKGNTFLTEQALQLNLIDGIVSSVPEYLNSLDSNKSFITSKHRRLNMSDEANVTKAELETAVQQAVKAERDRCLGILTAGKTLQISADTVEKYLMKGRSVEDATDMFTDLKAEKDASSRIDTSVVPFGKAPEQAAGASNEHYVPAFLKQALAQGAK